MSHLKFSFRGLLDERSRPYQDSEVQKWDLWSVFIDDLPVRWNEDGGTFDAWFRRGDHLPYKKIPLTGERAKGTWTNVAFVTPSTGRYGFHRTLIVSVGSNAGDSSRRCLFTFTTSKRRPPRLHVQVTQQGMKKFWVGCCSLWSAEAHCGDTLIEKFGNVEGHHVRSDIKSKIRQFLYMENPTWSELGNYRELRNRSRLSYGELIVVKNPGTRQSLAGVVVGDVAVAGLLSSRGRSSGQIIFLQLVDYREFHESDYYFLPLNYARKGSLQSVAIAGLRYAPSVDVQKWGKKSVVLPDDVMDDIRLRIEEVYLAED